MARNLRSAAPTANPSRAGSPPYRRVGSRRERGGAQVAQEPRHPGRLALRHARASVARRAALRRARRTASRPWTRERAAFRWWGAGHQDAEGATRSEDGYYCRPPPRDHSGDLVIGPTTIHCRLIPRAENGAREVAEACTQGPQHTRACSDQPKLCSEQREGRRRHRPNVIRIH